MATPASCKLDFPFAKRKATKSFIPVSSTEDDTVSMQEVSPIEGNLLISSTVLQDALTQMAVCSSCREGNLRLHHKSGIRSGSAMYVMIRCENTSSPKPSGRLVGNSSLQSLLRISKSRNATNLFSLRSWEDVW